MASAHPPLLQPRILPWAEVNRLDRLDLAVAALPDWSRVTDRVVITTVPGHAERVYTELMARKPDGLKIIGGVKPYSLPGASTYDPETYDFADAAGWEAIADVARKVTRITGTRFFVIENETALAPFHRGQERIDLDRLKTSLVALRITDITYWFNLPRIKPDTPAFPDRLARSTELVAAIALALPDCVFFSADSAWHGWLDDPQRMMTRRMLFGVVGAGRIQERLLVTPCGHWHYADGKTKRCYTVREALDMMQVLTGETINVFPGTAGWIDTAALFAATGGRSSR